MLNTKQAETSFRLFCINYIVLLIDYGGAKFVAVDDQSPFIPVISHLDRHTDLNGVVGHIGQQGGDSGTFLQFDECHRVGRVAVVASGCLTNEIESATMM